MSVVTGSLIPEGTRVKIRPGALPMDAAVVGRVGAVVDASEYRPRSYGVALDGGGPVRFFAPDELEVTRELPSPPEREAAKGRRALP